MGTLLVYAVLVSTHKGEFWPFSIYPMFSKAGRPWTRALVQDVSNQPDSLYWQTTDIEHLHGPVVALQNTGVEQIDFSNFVSKTDDWDQKRKQAIAKMFHASSLSGDTKWIVTKVRGHLTEDDSVIVDAIPFLMVTRDSVYENPLLPANSYTPQ